MEIFAKKKIPIGFTYFNKNISFFKGFVAEFDFVSKVLYIPLDVSYMGAPVKCINKV